MNGISTYQIKQELGNPAINKSFYRSPVWQTLAPAREFEYKQVMGQDADTSTPAARQWLTQAIIHNWDSNAFAQKLRDSPQYATSGEYKAQAAQYLSSYQRIYGVPQPNSPVQAVVSSAVDQAVRKGWNADQWDQYLRAQPAYQSSPEFKAQNINLAARMGLIPNEQAQTMLQQVNQQPVIPTPQVTPSGPKQNEAPAEIPPTT